MANVLIGIISITLFIGLALAGAVFFGPVLANSGTNAGALQYLTAVSNVAGAVSVMNKETGQLLPAATSVEVLTPDYISSIPTLANGASIVLVDATGAESTAAASYAAVDLGSTSVAQQACTFIQNSVTNGEYSYGSYGAWPSPSTRGCFYLSGAIGPFPAGDYVTYAEI